MKKLFLLLALLASMAISASATDVTVASSTIPGFNPPNLSPDVTLSNVSVTNGSPAVSCSNCLQSGWVGIGGYRIAINGVAYTVSYVTDRSNLTLTANYAGSTSAAASVIWYKYVELRIYADSSFQPLGKTYVVQPGAIDSGAWYKRTAASIVNELGVNNLYIPQIVLDATTDSPNNQAARYVAAFYRPGGSRIQLYDCFDLFSLPPSSPTSWPDVCNYNRAAAPVFDNSAYSRAQIDARFPGCTSGQMFYYAATGQKLDCLTVGSNLSITAGVLNATGGGGGGSGTVTSFSAGNLSPLFTSSVANPTTTPALTFAQVAQSANTFFSGPTSGGAANPTFRAITWTDISAAANDLIHVQNVKDGYACVGDGVANDTTCLSNAITAANSSTTKKIVYLPEGTYLITSGLTVPAGVTMRGAGATSIISTAGTIDVVTVSGDNITLENFRINGGRRGIVANTGVDTLSIRRMTFTGITAHTGGISTAAIYHTGQAADVWIEDNIFSGNGNLHAADDGADILIQGSATPFNNRVHINRNRISGGSSRFSVACFDCYNSEVTDNTIDQNNQIAASTPSDISGYGIVVYATVNAGIIRQNIISGNNVRNCAGSCIYGVNLFNSTISNNTVEDAAKQQVDGTLPVGGISCNSCDFTTIAGNVVNRSAANGIAISGNYGNVATLNGGINAAVTSITLSATSLLGLTGDTVIIQVDSEKISCTVNSATVINSCTRGVLGTSAASHSNGATVTPAGPSGVVVADNTVRAALGNGGINFRNRCEQCVVKGGSVSDSQRGVFQTSGTPLNGTEISGLKITRPSSNGIYIDSLSNGLIAGNVIDQPTAQGILLLAGTGTQINQNTVINGANAGLDIRGTDGTVLGNILRANATGITDSGVRNKYADNEVINNTTNESFGGTPTSQVLTITSGATPDLSGANAFIFTYGSPTTVTVPTGGLITNSRKTIYFSNSNVTLQHSGSLQLDSDKDYNPKSGDTFTMEWNGSGWSEVGRSTSTNTIVRDQFVAGTQTYGADFEAVKAASSVRALLRSTTATAFERFQMRDSADTGLFTLDLLNPSYPSNVMTGAATGPSANLYTNDPLDLNIGTNGVLRLGITSAGVSTFTGAVNITPTASLTLGTASSATGQILLKNSTNSNTLTIAPGVTTTSYTVSFPVAAPGSNNCLEMTSTGAIVVTGSTCGSGGGSISGSGTAGNLTKFTGTTSIGNALFTESGSTISLSGHQAITQTSTSTVPLTVTAVGSSSVELVRFQNSGGVDKFGVTADANPYWRGQTTSVTVSGASDAKVYFDKNAGAIDGELVASKGGGSFRPLVVASESSFTGNTIPLWDNSNSWEIKNSIITQTSTTSVTVAGKVNATAGATLAGVNVGSHTADPSTPTEGDVYYNSSTDKFRCYQNSAWVDCIGSGASLPVVDTTSIVEGSADNTKEIRFEVDGLTTGTVRVLTPPDADIVIAGSASALTSGRVPYVTTGGLLIDNSDFAWDNSSKFLTVNGSNSHVRIQGGQHPGTGGGVVMPFTGGSNSSGPGVWWTSNNYASQSGMWLSNGLNWQGASGTHAPVKLRKSTGTSSDGAIVFTLYSDSGYIENAPYGTSAGNTSENRFLELAANGTNYFAVKAADAITTTYTMTWPTDTPSAGEVLAVTGLSGGVISTEWAASGGGSSPPFADNVDLVKGSADATKLLRFEVDGFTTATTRTITVPDATGTMVLEATTQTVTNKTIDSANNTVILPISDLSDSTANVTFSQSTFNTTFNHTTGLWSTTWSGNTSTNDAFTLSHSNTTATGDLLQLTTSASVNVRPLRVSPRGNDSLLADHLGNVVHGNAALSTSATDGFFHLTTAAGAPSGTPATTYTGRAPVLVDTTNNRFYAYYGGSWVNLTGSGGGTPGGSNTQIQYNNAGAFGGISGFTSDGTNVTAGSGNLRATRPRFTTSIDDANGNESFILTATASAVNEWTFANAATGADPRVTASGGDTDVGFEFLVKGAGVYKLLASASGPTDLRLFEDSDNGSNYASLIAPASIASNRVLTLPDATDTLAGIAATQTLSNKTLDDSNTFQPRDDRWSMRDSGDTTKRLAFQLNGISTGTTRTLTIQDTSYTVAGTTVDLGGTGAGTFTTNGVLYGNATSAIQATAQGAANSILTANAGAPSFSQTPIINTSVQLGVASSQTGQLKLAVSGDADLTTLQAGDTPASAVTYKWPADDPAAAEVLTVTSFSGGTATLEWAAGGGGGGTTINATDGVMPYRSNSTTFADSPFSIASGRTVHTPSAVSSGVTAYARFITPADTNMTANTLAPGIVLLGDASGATVTRQFASGAYSQNQCEICIRQPTYAFTGATTMSGLTSTMQIAGPPLAGTNATISQRFALHIANGGAYIQGPTTSGQTLLVRQTTDNIVGSQFQTSNGTNLLSISSITTSTGQVDVSTNAQFLINSSTSVTHSFYSPNSAGTSSIHDILRYTVDGGGTSAGAGIGFYYRLTSATVNNRDAGRLAFAWSTATDATRTSDFIIQTVSNASVLTERFRVLNDTSSSLIYLGNGATNASPTSGTYTVTGGSGTNIAGANLNLAGGKGTGTGTPGSIALQFARAGSSGSTLNTLSESVTFSYASDTITQLAKLKSSTTAEQDAASIQYSWFDNTHASRTGAIYFNTVSGAAAIANVFSIESAQYYGTRGTQSGTGAQTINWNAGNVQEQTFTGNITFTFSNGNAGAIYVLTCIQDATGARTVTWPAAVKWPGGSPATLTAAANSKDSFMFYFDGTNYLNIGQAYDIQ